MIRVEGLSKTFSDGFKALVDVDLTIQRGEIFALLGPNGAGKTTLISVICGLVNASQGRVLVDGHDNVGDYRAARQLIGLVPQELTNEAFTTVWDTVSFSRGLFGKPKDPAHIEKVLRSLTLWEKRHSRLLELSGGMKRRVLIAKALSHEPQVLFLDEPTAGVDVELRREMWEVVRGLRDQGVTIILTTHYIEEAEEMADRIGVIRRGEIVLVENTHALMNKLGSKELTLQVQEPLEALPESLAGHGLALADEGHALVYSYDAARQEGNSTISGLLADLEAVGVRVKDLHTRQSSLEDIFVSLVQERR
ncbi:ABC transporter ATP-binding protein [Halomonas sp. CS7]|uniref:ABC transporter ATP-binding protein n=1 Tax=Halomonas pelophila TaxID=3151122 RepID=A0ABV1N972_9GAMM